MNKFEKPDLQQTAVVLDCGEIHQRGGRNYIKCFRPEAHTHNDTTPSLELRNDGRWFCNVCDRDGDSYGLIKFALNVDFVAALQWAKDHGLVSDHGRRPNISDQTEKPKCAPMTAKRWADALWRMDRPGPHLDWLSRFKIIEEAWRGVVGYDPEAYDTLDKKRPALIYAKLDQAGKPVGPYALRYIDTTKRDVKTRVEVFLLGAHCLPAALQEPVLVCAGDKDTLTARTLGFCAVGLLGEGCFPKDGIEALRGRRVILALDADEAGRNAAAKHLRILRDAGIDACAIAWLAEWLKEGAKDLTDFVTGGHGKEAIATLIAEATAEAAKYDAKPKVVAPGLGRPLREFALDVAREIAPLNEWFVRNDEVVVVRWGKVLKRNRPRPRFIPLTAAMARTHAERFINFVTKSQKGTVSTPISENAFDTVLVCSEFQDCLPHVDHIVNCPMPYIPPDGSVAFAAPGYNAEAHMFCTSNFSLDFMAATEAADILLQDLLGDFCFSDREADAANALGLLLTPMIAALEPMLTPAFLIRGNRPGVGKTWLARLTGVLYDGVDPPIQAPVKDEELRKQLTSLLRAGTRLCIIDNIRGHLSCPTLEAFLTSPVWVDRVLGFNEIVTLRNDLLLILTSNGMTVTSDLVRRCVLIDLAYFDEQLNARTYRHTDLLAHAREHRRIYVSAIASMIKAWIEEGKPEGRQSMPTFDPWAKSVGGVLDIAAVKGLLKNKEKQSDELDQEGAELRTLLSFWSEKYGFTTTTARDLLMLAHEHELFTWIAPDQIRRFGKMLAQYRNRVFGKWQIIEPQKKNPIRYALKVVNKP